MNHKDMQESLFKEIHKAAFISLQDLRLLHKYGFRHELRMLRLNEATSREREEWTARTWFSDGGKIYGTTTYGDTQSLALFLAHKGMVQGWLDIQRDNHGRRFFTPSHPGSLAQRTLAYVQSYDAYVSDLATFRPVLQLFGHMAASHQYSDYSVDFFGGFPNSEHPEQGLISDPLKA